MTKEYMVIKGLKIIDRNRIKRRNEIIKECLLLTGRLAFCSGTMMIIGSVENMDVATMTQQSANILGILGIACVLISALAINALSK